MLITCDNNTTSALLFPLIFAAVQATPTGHVVELLDGRLLSPITARYYSVEDVYSSLVHTLDNKRFTFLAQAKTILCFLLLVRSK